MQQMEYKHKSSSLPAVPTKHAASVHPCWGFWFAGVLSHRNASGSYESWARTGQCRSPPGSSQPGGRGSKNTCRVAAGARSPHQSHPARCPPLTAPRGLPRTGAAPADSLRVAVNNSQPGSSRDPGAPRSPAPSRPHPGSCPGGT